MNPQPGLVTSQIADVTGYDGTGVAEQCVPSLATEQFSGSSDSTSIFGEGQRERVAVHKCLCILDPPFHASACVDSVQAIWQCRGRISPTLENSGLSVELNS